MLCTFSCVRNAVYTVCDVRESFTPSLVWALYPIVSHCDINSTPQHQIFYRCHHHVLCSRYILFRSMCCTAHHIFCDMDCMSTFLAARSILLHNTCCKNVLYAQLQYTRAKSCYFLCGESTRSLRPRLIEMFCLCCWCWHYKLGVFTPHVAVYCPLYRASTVCSTVPLLCCLLSSAVHWTIHSMDGFTSIIIFFCTEGFLSCTCTAQYYTV